MVEMAETRFKMHDSVVLRRTEDPDSPAGTVVQAAHDNARVLWPGSEVAIWHPNSDLKLYAPPRPGRPAFAVGDRVWGTHPGRIGYCGEVIEVDNDREFLTSLVNVRWDDPGMDDEWFDYSWLSKTPPLGYSSLDGGTRSLNWNPSTEQPATRLNVHPGVRVRTADGSTGTVVSASQSYRGPQEDLVKVDWDNDGRKSGAGYEELTVIPAVSPQETRQPAPTPNDLPHVADLVIADIRIRKAHGLVEYGTPLQPRNGRKALRDLYEEILDAAQYVRQEIWEREHQSAHHTEIVEEIRNSIRGYAFRCECGVVEGGAHHTKPAAQQAANQHTIERLRAQAGLL